MDSHSDSENPKIIEFGPRRIIGMSYTGSIVQNGPHEIPQFWEKTFLPREAEIVKPDGVREAFGVCRCIPGATDGSFEYIAAFAAAEDAPVPEGMMALVLPQFRYAAFRAENLAGIAQAWDDHHRWVGETGEWDTLCGPKGCECATHPGFEYYPPEFGEKGGPLFIYIPVRAKTE